VRGVRRALTAKQTSGLNKHLTSYMKGLTAKVFRTYNASITFQQQLDEGTPASATVQEKLNAYNKANRMVAILCNHQRTVPKTHEASMGKMRDKVRVLAQTDLDTALTGRRSARSSTRR
jgi:DNA topoisomerase-1